jgi:hypothetical protein
LMNNHNPRRGVLLASFLTSATEDAVMVEVQAIADTMDLTNNLIFLLQDKENPENKILTYNAAVERGQAYNPRLFTMRVHRKKQTATLYTINALNLAVAQDHEGQTGKHLKLDWEKYANCILLATSGKLNVCPVEVTKVFKIEPEEPVPATEDPAPVAEDKKEE